MTKLINSEETTL